MDLAPFGIKRFISSQAPGQKKEPTKKKKW